MIIDKNIHSFIYFATIIFIVYWFATISFFSSSSSPSSCASGVWSVRCLFMNEYSESVRLALAF